MPSPGDLFLDLEGDPFALDDGIDYLFGILEPALPETDPRWAAADGPPVPRFHAIWSLDEAGQVTWAAEKAAFEQTVDLMIDRLDRDPAMHVYHYAAYERTALGRLAQRHGTREEEVDRLLRGGVLVDLFKAVRQGLRAGVESYSIKRHRAAVRASTGRSSSRTRAAASSRSRRGSSWAPRHRPRTRRRSSTGSPATTATTW